MTCQSGERLLILLLLSSLVAAVPIQKQLAVDKPKMDITDIEKDLKQLGSDLEELLDDINLEPSENHLKAHGHFFTKAIDIVGKIEHSTLKFLNSHFPEKISEYHLENNFNCSYGYGIIIEEYGNVHLSKICKEFIEKEIILTLKSDRNCFLSSLYQLIDGFEEMQKKVGVDRLKYITELINNLDSLAKHIHTVTNDVIEKIKSSCQDYAEINKVLSNETEITQNGTLVPSLMAADGVETLSNKTVVSTNDTINTTLNEAEITQNSTLVPPLMAADGVETLSNKTVVSTNDTINTTLNEAEIIQNSTLVPPLMAADGVDIISNETELLKNDTLEAADKETSFKETQDVNKKLDDITKLLINVIRTLNLKSENKSMENSGEPKVDESDNNVTPLPDEVNNDENMLMNLINDTNVINNTPEDEKAEDKTANIMNNATKEDENIFNHEVLKLMLAPETTDNELASSDVLNEDLAEMFGEVFK